MIDKLLCLAAASSDIFHAGPFQTPLTKFAARGRDNGGNSVLRRPFGRNLLASHHSRSARMPVSIAGMQVGAPVSSSQDIRTCPSASQTIRGRAVQINNTSQPPPMRWLYGIVYIYLTDREDVFKIGKA